MIQEEFNYANMQSVLLGIGCMFFVLGSTLEYTKYAVHITAGITLAMGVLKTFVRLLINKLSLDGMHFFWIALSIFGVI